MVYRDKRGRIRKGEYEVGHGKPPHHKGIKKGEVRNPLGKNDALKAAFTRMSRDELIDIGNMIMQGSVEELKAVVKDPRSSAVKVMVAALVARVIQRGDTTAFNALLDRIVGPVKHKMELTGRNGAPLATNAAQVLLYLPKNGKTKEENDPGSGNNNPPPTTS